MRALTIDEAIAGRRVIYVGRVAPSNITRRDLLEGGHILMEHHPGTIDHASDDGLVFIRFVGLEDEPLTDVGWMPDENARYPGLVLVDPDEWEAALVSGWWAGATPA
ncbi:hypothetical protein ACWEOW_02955 [Monashia sp. NPDC004114]